MDGLGKVLASRYPVAQVVWARYAFAVPVLLLLTRPGRWPSLLRCERPLLQVGRGLLPLLASVTVIVGLLFIPLADATAIGFASPLLVAVLSILTELGLAGLQHVIVPEGLRQLETDKNVPFQGLAAGEMATE